MYLPTTPFIKAQQTWVDKRGLAEEGAHEAAVLGPVADRDSLVEVRVVGAGDGGVSWVWRLQS